MIEAGRVYTLAAGVRRITAPNPGVMTGAGTNCYLLGNERVAVVDPGPAIAEHIDAILAAVAEEGGVVDSILVTHTHPDHSPAAKLLAERSGARVIGAVIEQDGFQDADFSSDASPADGEAIVVGGRRILALHTPGHVGNHYCYLDEDSGLVFTGDHIMQGSTVVIIPPAGDMSAYIDSLKKLLLQPVTALAPGHGELIAEASEEIERVITHRLGREAKVVEVLNQCTEGSLKTLTPAVYDDVDAKLHPIALLSLWAHLRKLHDEGLVVADIAAYDGDQDLLWRWLGD